ncbi:hypothetical protein [Sandaracinus amylolyticus]|uniref:TolA protein n=1 Tax=Sandaracinus amylolyticus TaxID=927083 RepID=A0A0F6VZ30_9BACT|nr:hypothetical protein [Sandaracinus amylolyticus]AKF03280.1 hypothetical protein DB32_000429 [Sandaracinus amylolyticus]
MRELLVVSLLLALSATTVRAQDVIVEGEQEDAREEVPGSAAGLRSRIAALEERAERANATELLDQARRALTEADRRRAAGDPVAAARAEAIADAALRVVERRIEAQRARADRDAARARLGEAQARATAAREALERARAEHARMQRAADAPPPASEGAAGAGEE